MDLTADGHVDHLVPRRLVPPGEPDSPENLALLCEACHGIKTGTIEPALYRADILTFQIFLVQVARTGPVPAAAALRAAYGRCAALIRSEARF